MLLLSLRRFKHRRCNNDVSDRVIVTVCCWLTTPPSLHNPRLLPYLHPNTIPTSHPTHAHNTRARTHNLRQTVAPPNYTPCCHSIARSAWLSAAAASTAGSASCMLRDLPLLLLDLLRLLPFLLLLLPPCSHQPVSGSWQATTSHKCAAPSPLTAHISSHTGSISITQAAGSTHRQQAAYHTQAAGSM